MDLKFSTHQVNSYKINTSVYQGPLDLLLQLIETAELDITSLSLAQVTDQYMQHLESLSNLPADEISAFLVIAAKLIQIKSEALLPSKSLEVDQEEDVGDELARQLIAYKRYKEIADILADRKELGYQSYIRLSTPPLEKREYLDFADFDVQDLFKLASTVFQKDIDRHSINTVVERPKITIKDKIYQITERFAESDEITFRELLGVDYTKIDVVILFLALLELLKGNLIVVVQKEMFDDIKMKKVKAISEMRNYALKNLEL